MIKTIYTCDKCGKEQPTREQFWKVGVTARSEDYYSEKPPEFVEHMTMHVCRPCLEGFGINVRKRDPVPATVPTLEDLIREIVETAIAQAQS